MSPGSHQVVVCSRVEYKQLYMSLLLAYLDFEFYNFRNPCSRIVLVCYQYVFIHLFMIKVLGDIMGVRDITITICLMYGSQILFYW